MSHTHARTHARTHTHTHTHAHLILKHLCNKDHPDLSVQVRSSRTGKQVYVIQHTDSYKANPDIADAFGAAAPVLMTYIPLLALMAINVATVWALRRHNVKTKRVQSSADELSLIHISEPTRPP